MSAFHERVNKLRADSGVTQTELAKHLGVSPQALSYIMNGREPKYDLLVKIASYFDVTTDFLLGKSSFQTQDDSDVFGTFLSDLSILVESMDEECSAALRGMMFDIFDVLIKLEDSSDDQFDYLTGVWGVVKGISNSAVIVFDNAPAIIETENEAWMVDTNSSLWKAYLSVRLNEEKTLCVDSINTYYSDLIKSVAPPDSASVKSSSEILSELITYVAKNNVKIPKGVLEKSEIFKDQKGDVFKGGDTDGEH